MARESSGQKNLTKFRNFPAENPKVIGEQEVCWRNDFYSKQTTDHEKRSFEKDAEIFHSVRKLIQNYREFKIRFFRSKYASENVQFNFEILLKKIGLSSILCANIGLAFLIKVNVVIMPYLCGRLVKRRYRRGGTGRVWL